MSELEAAVTAAEQAEADARSKVHLWQAAERTRQAELEQLEAQLGEVMVDDPAAGEALVEDAARLRERLQATSQALATARGRWEATRPGIALAQADVIRDQAAGLWAQARERQEITQRLLDQLAEHEGVAYGVTDTGLNGGPALSRTGQLIEQARQLDAQAAALVASVRGEGVQVSPGPIAPGGRQAVHIAAHAVCEGMVPRRFAILVDGAPLQQPDGRPDTITIGYGQPRVSRTIEVPAGSVVEVIGDTVRASTDRQPLPAAV